MPPYKVLRLLFLVLVVAASGIAQEEKLKVNKDGQLEVSPEMTEKAKRRRERLRDPSFIKLEIEPESNCQDEESKKVSDCYKAHGKIELKLLMTNMSSEAITITINNSYDLHHLQLFRDGQLVPYRKEVAKVIDNPPPFVSSIAVNLESGETEIVGIIYLDTWHKPLESGHYQLDIKHRFLSDGGWTNTASTTFEVEPE
ncbi:MAG TPA: hypothetical protein VF791_20105 [Pyrinomonadaceae bacterium]